MEETNRIQRQIHRTCQSDFQAAPATPAVPASQNWLDPAMSLQCAAAKPSSVGASYQPMAANWPPFLTGQTEKPVRVIVVDDDSHMRNIICNELLADGRTDVVGSADSLRQGRRLVNACEFDVMLVDLNLGDGDGFELIALMKNVRSMSEAIVISAMEDEARAIHAFELGATGYLVKNSWFGNFSQAVLQVVNGGASITPNLARRLLHKLERPKAELLHRANPVKQALSGREQAVLKMVAVGYTSCEIGAQLLITTQTVNSHIKNIYGKLQVKTRAHAVTAGAERGLL